METVFVLRVWEELDRGPKISIFKDHHNAFKSACNDVYSRFQYCNIDEPSHSLNQYYVDFIWAMDKKDYRTALATFQKCNLYIDYYSRLNIQIDELQYSDDAIKNKEL